jgi:gluconokinase
MSKKPQALVLMGVSGCGKSSVGEALSHELSWPFYDGDDFHPPENVAKMAVGYPLNDADRAPWLKILNVLISDHLTAGESILLACSALKKKYRDQLAEGNSEIKFIHLKGSFELILSRMKARTGHFMQSEMLQSQFDTLEEPDNAIVVNIEHNLAQIAAQIINELHLDRNTSME